MGIKKFICFYYLPNQYTLCSNHIWDGVVLANPYTSVQGITDTVKSLLATRKSTEDE